MNDLNQLADDQLIQIIQNKDEAGLGVLFERYKRYLTGVAYNVVGSREMAEEVVLDIFTRVWEKGHTFDGKKGSLRGWLTRMTRNRAIDYLRKSGQKIMDSSVEWGEVQDNLIPSSSPTGNPEKMTELALLAEQVRAVMETLPEEQKSLIGLAYFKGLSNSKIAEATGIPLGTVKTRIRLGMKKLRETLVRSESAR